MLKFEESWWVFLGCKDCSPIFFQQSLVHVYLKLNLENYVNLISYNFLNTFFDYIKQQWQPHGGLYCPAYECSNKLTKRWWNLFCTTLLSKDLQSSNQYSNINWVFLNWICWYFVYLSTFEKVKLLTVISQYKLFMVLLNMFSK